MGRMKKVDGWPYYQIVITNGRIPKAFMEFCRRRIGNLAAFEYARHSMIDVLAIAYQLGMKDAMEYYEKAMAEEPALDYQI